MEGGRRGPLTGPGPRLPHGRPRCSQTPSAAKILVVGHRYILDDRLLGDPIISKLNDQDVGIVRSDDMPDLEAARDAASTFSPSLKWSYNREQIGAVVQLHDQIDGILMLVSFPCGPGFAWPLSSAYARSTTLPSASWCSMNSPGAGGLQTRLESFCDIVRMRRSRMSDSATTSTAAPAEGSRLGDARRVMTFPHMGEYHYAIRCACRPHRRRRRSSRPRSPARRSSWVRKHSPEFVCVPSSTTSATSSRRSTEAPTWSSRWAAAVASATTPRCRRRSCATWATSSSSSGSRAVPTSSRS